MSMVLEPNSNQNMSESSQNHTKTSEKGVGAKNVPSTQLNRHQRRSAAYYDHAAENRRKADREARTGMTTNQLEALDTAFDERKVLQRRLCTNAEVVIVPVEENQESDEYEYALENDGCVYDRRNGSKYCQGCSDAYHAEKIQ